MFSSLPSNQKESRQLPIEEKIKKDPIHTQAQMIPDIYSFKRRKKEKFCHNERCRTVQQFETESRTSKGIDKKTRPQGIYICVCVESPFPSSYLCSTSMQMQFMIHHLSFFLHEKLVEHYIWSRNVCLLLLTHFKNVDSYFG